MRAYRDVNDQPSAFVAPEAIRELVQSCLIDLLRDRDARSGTVISPDTRLIGPGGVLDSLGLVTLIVELEDRLFSDHGVSVTLADDRAMSQERSPFLTVDTLSRYIAVVLVDAR